MLIITFNKHNFSVFPVILDFFGDIDGEYFITPNSKILELSIT